MLDLSATIDNAAATAINDAIATYAKTLGRTPQEAVRYASILICKSLRAATRKSPNFARASEYIVSKSSEKPIYITKDGVSKRRFDVDWHVKGVKFSAYAKSKSDLRKARLRLRNTGLARKSWGWVMRRLYNGEGDDVVWQRRKNDRRDPTEAVSESRSHSFKRGDDLVSEATISNRLDYIVSSLKPGASVSACVTSAGNKMLALMRQRVASGRP